MPLLVLSRCSRHLWSADVPSAKDGNSRDDSVTWPRSVLSRKRALESQEWGNICRRILVLERVMSPVPSGHPAPFVLGEEGS